jgi:hypothetical protein
LAGRAGLWASLAGLTFLLLSATPFGSRSPLLPRMVLFWAGHLPFLLIFIAFAWHGPLWGAGVTAWAVGLMGLIGLGSAGEGTLFWLPVLFLLFGALVYWGLGLWEQTLGGEVVRAGRVEEQVNTGVEEIHRLAALESAMEERLRRYQQLR